MADTRDRMVAAPVTVPESVLSRLEAYAQRHGLSRAAVQRLAISHGLDFLETWGAPQDQDQEES